MSDPGGVRKRVAKSKLCFSDSFHHHSEFSKQASLDSFCPLLPGLPDDVAKFCLALILGKYLPTLGAVSKRWRSFIQSKEFIAIRRKNGMLNECIYFLTGDPEGKGIHWEAMSSSGGKRWLLPPMPGPVKAGFGVVAFEGKLLIMGGCTVGCGMRSASADVYQYDAQLNRWCKLEKMNVARYDFACAELNGMIYAVGGYGSDGDSLSSAEVYDPERNGWTLIESLRRPRYGSFAFSIKGKLYVMGGRSSFTIGNSRLVDAYCPEQHSWCEMKSRGCVMVTSHAVIGQQLFCMEWKNERMLCIFDPEDNSWRKVAVPLTGSSTKRFHFGVIDGKLLLFSMEEDSDYQTLVYDPASAAGSEWSASLLKPSGLCLFAVTIKT